MKLSSILPPHIQPAGLRVILNGERELLIEQHTGLFSYETKCIRVRTKAGLLSVRGENLIIVFFGAHDLLIQGRVDGIAIEREKQ